MGSERVSARKKNRRLISISDGVGGGGNGIVGLLMFGGALAATAAFVAAASFVFNRNKTKDTTATHPKPKPQHQQQQSLNNSEEDHHEIETIQEGLRALLKPSTTPTNEGNASGHGEIHTKSINNTCVTEEKIEAVPVSEEVHEIVLSDDSNPESEALLQDRQGCSEAQDVEVEAQEIQQSVEVETEQGDVVLEIEKEEDFNEKPNFGAAEEDISDAAIGWMNVTAKASSDEKDSDQPSSAEIDKEDGSLLNSNEKPDFCPTEGGGNREDKIDDTTDADNGVVTFTAEASSDEKDSDQSSTASHSFQLPTRVMPLLLLPFFFILLLIIDRIMSFLPTDIRI